MMGNVNITLVAAVSENGVIGCDGELPWDLPDDRKHFAKLTTGHMVVMGRKTYESIPPKYRPLSKRKNIVVTRRIDYEAPGCIVVTSWESALAEMRMSNNEVYVIGGEEIYRLALPYARTVYLTKVAVTCLGDAVFPSVIDSSWSTSLIKKVDGGSGNEFAFVIVKMIRNSRHGDFLLSEHARSDEQRDLMARIRADGLCPFCPENILSYHEMPILKDGKWWMVTENRSPYENARIHLLLIYKSHVRMQHEVALAAHAELSDLIRWIVKEHEVQGGSLLWRFGDMMYSGASVDHLHLHFVVGHGDPNRRVRAKIS